MILRFWSYRAIVRRTTMTVCSQDGLALHKHVRESILWTGMMNTKVAHASRKVSTRQNYGGVSECFVTIKWRKLTFGLALKSSVSAIQWVRHNRNNVTVFENPYILTTQSPLIQSDSVWQRKESFQMTTSPSIWARPEQVWIEALVEIGIWGLLTSLKD